MNQIFFAKKCRFLTAATHLKALPPPVLPEIAFAGRSNVGKSSLINALVHCHNLARVSQHPGRTQALIVFNLADQALLVDLPGYGFAQAPVHRRRVWQQLTKNYFMQRRCLTLLLIDIRRGLGSQDQIFIDQLNHMSQPYHVVITKADKLLCKTAEMRKEELINALDPSLSFWGGSLTSARCNLGLKELRGQLTRWINTPSLIPGFFQKADCQQADRLWDIKSQQTGK